MTPAFLSTVEELFTVYMTANHPTVPFYFTNSAVPEELGTYAVLHVLASEDVLPINVGINAKSRNVGVIQVDVYTPKETGGGVGNTLAYQIGRLFKRQNVNVGTEGHIVFKDSAVQDRGEVRGRHKEQMRCPYRYDFQDFDI